LGWGNALTWVGDRLADDLGHARAGREVAALAPNNKRGFSLADLQLMGAKRGVQLVGFRARAAQMVGAPLPLVLHYAARQVAPTTSRHLKNAKLKGAPVRSLEDYAHFVVVRGYDAKAKRWSVFNPQDGARALLTCAQLDKESSSTGLMLAKAAPVNAPQKAVWLANWPQGRKVVASPVGAQTVSLARLSKAQMQGIVGTCYAVRAPGGLGVTPNDVGVCIPCLAHSLGLDRAMAEHRGEPAVSVDSISQNILMQDTPVWYEPAKGPSVEVSVSYNSQDASNYDSPTGNGWTFGFTSHVAEMPNQVSVFMPDGAQDVYTSPVSSGTTTTYTAPRGVLSKLTKTAEGTFTLSFQGGEQWTYGIPGGTAGMVPMLLSQADRWGQSLTLQYGTVGGKIVPFTLTDADGKLTRFQYDGNGRLIYAQTPDERQASFSYDPNGNLIQCVDAAGQAFQYAYGPMAVDNPVASAPSVNTVTQLNTSQGSWTFSVGATGNGTTYSGMPGGGQPVYRNFKTLITDPTQSHPQSFVFTTDDGYHNPGHYYFTDHTGNQTNFSVTTLNPSYDPNPLSVISGTSPPVGSSISYSYDTTSGSRLTAPLTVSNGRTTTALSYNGQGQLLQSQTSAGYYGSSGNNRTTQLTYDSANGLDVVGASVSGSVTNTSTNPATTQTQSLVLLQNASYNGMHQPLSVVDAQGHQTETSYTSWGAPLSVTVHEGNVAHITQYVYGQTQGTNEFNRMVAVVQDGVTHVTYTYDASGRVHTATDATGLTTVFRFSALDTPLGVYYPDGSSQLTDYSCCALPGMVTDRSGRRSYYDYDQLKRPVRVQDADGQTLQLTYNADGDCLSSMDANGVKTKWAYDGNHRVTAKQYADGSGESWDYTNDGLLNSVSNGRNAKTTFGYSGFGQLTNVTYPTTATPNVSLSYDALGRGASMTDGIGTTTWSYDSAGHLIGESGPFGNDGISYGYDSLDRLTNLSVGRDATTADTQSFGFDGLGRLASLTANTGAFGNVGTFNYSYVGNTDILARLDKPNGTSTVLSYENLQNPNALHRLVGVQDINSASGANIAAFGYGYDAPSTQNGFADNRTSQTRAYGAEAAQTVSYGYGPTSMLQGEGATQGGVSTPALSKTYAFDPMGNRTGYVDAVAKTQTTSTHNNLNQLVSTTNYDTSSGQAVATGSSAFGYDGDGNMNAVATKDASGTTTGQTSYAYDDASRLIGITAPDGSKWQFVYDGMSRLRVSRQFDKTGALVPGSEKRRVYLGMDVVQERDANNNVVASYSGGLMARSTATGTVFYGYDGSGNVTTLTDGTGATVGSYTYDAWGNTTSSSGAKAQENPYRYFGKEQLAGFYYYGYRFYSPGMGRWINQDPLGELGGLNFYCFNNDSPTNYVDPDGACPLLVTAAIGAGAGAIIGGGVAWYQGKDRKGILQAAGKGAVIGGIAGLTGGFAGGAVEGAIGGGFWGGAAGGAVGGAVGDVAGQGAEIELGWRDCYDWKQTVFSAGIGGFTGGVSAADWLCFTAGTPVVLANGATRAIEQLKVGDKVLARDEATGKTEAKRVKRLFKHQVEATLVLSFSNGEKIECTKEHPFYVEHKGFTPAGELGIGTSIVTRAGPSVKLTQVEVKRETATVYNFEVEDLHSYFVGQSGLWVHNKCVGYDQARNQALEWLEQRGFQADIPSLARFPRNNPGPPNGMMTSDGKTGFRVEFDERSGAHINVWSGKDKGPHFQFDGTMKTVIQIVKRFSR